MFISMPIYVPMHLPKPVSVPVLIPMPMLMPAYAYAFAYAHVCAYAHAYACAYVYCRPSPPLPVSLSAPRTCDCAATKRIVKYLIGKPRLVWRFAWQAPPKFVSVFSDSNWARCQDTDKITS